MRIVQKYVAGSKASPGPQMKVKITDTVIFGVVDFMGFLLQDLAFAASPNVQYQHAAGLKRFFRSFEILPERGAILEDHVAENSKPLPIELARNEGPKRYHG